MSPRRSPGLLSVLLIPILTMPVLSGCASPRRGEVPTPSVTGDPEGEESIRGQRRQEGDDSDFAPSLLVTVASTGTPPVPVQGRPDPLDEDCGERASCEARLRAESLLAEKRWREAIPYLEQQVEEHPNDPVLPFLLARAGAQALGEERCAWDRSSVAGVRAALERAFSYGVARVRAVREPDLEIMRMSLWFQFAVIGRDPGKAEELRQALVESSRLVAVGTAKGAFGAQAGIDFNDGGHAVAWKIDVFSDPPRVRASARWTVSPEGTVTVELMESPPWDDPSMTFEGRVVNGEFLELPGFGTIGDDDFECSA